MIKQTHNRPIFILGNPRSGTSLLRLMLTCHPQIVIPPESHFFLWLESKYESINPATDSLDRFYEDLFNSRKFETWNLSKDSILDTIHKASPGNYAELITCIYLTYAKTVGKADVTYWGDKNKLWKEKLSRILYYFPDAYFIHLVRDGRDVACSFIDLARRKNTSNYAPRLPDQIEDIAFRWKTNVNFISSFLDEVKEGHQMTVRYEDMLADTASTLRNIVTFLTLEYSDKMLQYLNPEFELIKEPKEFMEWKQKLNSLPDIQNIGKYKKELDGNDVRRFEKLAKEELYKFGYLV